MHVERFPIPCVVFQFGPWLARHWVLSLFDARLESETWQNSHVVKSRVEAA